MSETPQSAEPAARSVPTTKPRLAVLATPTTQGAGVYTYWRRLAPHLERHGWTVHLFLGHEETDWIPTPPLALNWASIAWVRKSLLNHLRDEQVTHIITSIPQSDILVHTVAKCIPQSCAWFVFAHAQPYPVAGQTNAVKTSAWKAAWRRAARRADGAIAVSGAVARLVDKIAGVDSAVVPPVLPDVSPKAPRLSSTGRFEVGYVGRISYEKDPLLFGSISRCLDDVAVHVFGEGPLTMELQSLLPTAQFHGVVHSRDAIYSRLHVLLMPSRMEGLGQTILEAAVWGVAPIAADVGGVAEAIHPSLRELLLVPTEARDDLVAWTTRVNALRSDRLRHSVCVRQRDWVEQRFGAEAVVESLEHAILRSGS